MDGGGQGVAFLVVVLLILLALSSRTGTGWRAEQLGRQRGRDKDILLGSVLDEKHAPPNLLEARIDPKLPEDFRKPPSKQEPVPARFERPLVSGWQPPNREEDYARSQAKAHRANAEQYRREAAELRRKADDLEARAAKEDRMADDVWPRLGPPWRS
jgi:hypothetical protein